MNNLPTSIMEECPKEEEQDQDDVEDNREEQEESDEDFAELVAKLIRGSMQEDIIVFLGKAFMKSIIRDPINQKVSRCLDSFKSDVLPQVKLCNHNIKECTENVLKLAQSVLDAAKRVSTVEKHGVSAFQHEEQKQTFQYMGC
jgi:hypothetical protein